MSITSSVRRKETGMHFLTFLVSSLPVPAIAGVGLLLSRWRQSADNVFSFEANDTTTDSISLTIEVYVQGEGTLVESRVCSGMCQLPKQPHKGYYKQRTILLIIQLNKS
jgi:hypothetical protein